MNEEQPLRVVIVDDEPLARGVVREFAQRQPGVEVVAECANGFEAVKAVSELHPDLLFLDVQMPKLDGFEVLELVGRDVAVVFVTAYDQYAIRAFEVHAVDYLLKPFSPERLGEALAQAFHLFYRRPESLLRGRAGFSSTRNGQWAGRLQGSVWCDHKHHKGSQGAHLPIGLRIGNHAGR